MSESKEKPSALELYGKATLVTILVLFAIEMAVLVPLIRFGMDISPLTSWIDSSFGSSLTGVSLAEVKPVLRLLIDLMFSGKRSADFMGHGMCTGLRDHAGDEANSAYVGRRFDSCCC